MRPPTPAQRRAADPAGSVWVTANAGTGKTRVLSDRVLRLLLDGADPEGVFCLTFTKAAAAEMTARVEARLAAWATAGDEALAGELHDLTGTAPDGGRLARARRLFAQVLELPRGLGIMTIHALCGSLLRRFPLEAGVAPHFETIDDRTAGELMQEAREAVLRRAGGDPGPLGQAMQRLAVTLGEARLGDALNELLGQRLRLLAARAAQGGTEALVGAVYRAFQVDPAVEPPALLARACADGVHDAQGLLELANAFATGGKRQQEAARAIAAWLNAVAADRVTTFEVYEAAFLTRDKKHRCDVCSAKFQREQDVVHRHYVREQVRLGDVCRAIKGLLIARRTEALLRIAFEVIDAYEGLKRHAAALDYDDLIERARALLHQDGKAAWVLFKLDARIDHVLVDEAQDTSPRQWAIVERLVEEFHAGAGANAADRTLFVVGDEKQSIYSFQGADLANFRRVRERLAGRAAAADRPFRAEMLDRSFRSVRAVLDLVDAVFALPEAAAGVVEAGATVRHGTERGNEPGLVELWPLARPAELGPSEEPWPLPDAPRVSDEPERRVARAVAGRVRDWLHDGERLESTGDRLRPGDILILLARRGIVQELVIRALKQAGVPVAGADRLALRDHIAVMDLLALGRVMLLPEDDLNLACLLKSPLVGLDEDDLFALAWDRGEASLLERLRALAERQPARFAAAYGRLAGWLRRADFMPPFEFFTWVLGPDGGRQRLLARLGPDAIEPIEAFLGQALWFEEGHAVSLEGFLHWVCMGADELKRDPEGARDLVRVTTVHGAKGLEAPVVILADAGPRGAPRGGRLLWAGPEHGHGHELPLWRPSSAEREGLAEVLVAAEREAAAEEGRRLLYVALTRARDRLYVTGWLPRKAAKAAGEEQPATPTSWHALVEAAIRELPEAAQFDPALGHGLTGTGWRYRRGVAVAGTAEAKPSRPEQTESLPAWASRPPAAEPERLQPLSPARDGGEAGDAALDSPLTAATELRRGAALHRLLQLLPKLAPADRPAGASRLVARIARDLSTEAQAELVEATLGLLDRPELAALFAPDARSEQPIAGYWGGRAVLGQIDRMAVGAREVLIVEYKSRRLPPDGVARTPAADLRQLAAYRAVLGAIYPGRAIRTGLLWTTGPRFDLVPDELLDRFVP